MKKAQSSKRVKVMVSIIGQHDEAKLTEVINRFGVAMHFSGIGHGTARSHHRSYFGLDDVEKRVTYSLIPSYLEKQILFAVEKELKLYLAGRGNVATDVHSRLQGSNVLLGQGELDVEHVGLIHVSRRGKQSVGQVAVVGQEHKPRGVLIQPSAWEKGGTDPPQLLREEIQDSLLPPILGGAHHSVGLMHENIGKLSIGYGLTLEPYRDGVGIHLHIRLLGGSAVHKHLATPYRLGGFGTGGDAGQTQIFVKPHSTHARPSSSKGSKPPSNTGRRRMEKS